MTQLTFDLPRRTALGRSDFFVSASNAAAAGWIDRWPDWPSGVLVLHGPAGCGKTHLVHLWCERASAVVVVGEELDEERVALLVANGSHQVALEGADRAPERALLHLYNCCLENRGSLLVTARRPPTFWSVELSDLASRLRATLAVGIGLPDDTLLSAILVKHFADRQLTVAPELIAYLVRRMERSFAAAGEITARLDAAALRDKSAVSIALARRLLALDGHQALPPSSESGVT
jgi:chromosomal replication initiation ATPase DnaA